MVNFDVLLVSYYALFASALSVNKIILQTYLSIWFFVALRRLSAGFLLFGYHFFTSPRMHPHYIKKDALTILGISVMTMFIPSVLKAYSFKNLVSSKAAFLGSLDPFITAIYAYLLWGERLTFSKLLGMSISFIGIVILLAMTSPAENVIGGVGIISWPELAMIGALIISRYGWIVAREVLKTERYSSSELNSLIMISSGLLALMGALFMGECDFCSIPVTSEFVAYFIYSVIFGEMIGYTIYGNLLKKHNIVYLSLAGLSIPLFVYLYGPLLLNEPLSSTFFIAFIFFASGMYIFYRNDLD
jgi:drug/metabolite transporter (DMT)-like permease